MQHVDDPWACKGCPECRGWKRIPCIPPGAVRIPPVYACAGAGPFAGHCGRPTARADALCARCESVSRYHAQEAA